MKKLGLIGLLFASCSVFAQDYQHLFSNKRLIMVGGSCAGIQFNKNAKQVKMRAEFDCRVNDSYSSIWRVRWISDNTFLAIETERNDDTSPPRVFANQVIEVKGNKAKIKDIWTGWGALQDTINEYVIQK